ncbi:MAG TPA: DUF91 domain-containing protein [Candidatus Altiarchaeales archaeon]|nr:DUF91 domain-containing protein [Candidatus Altiarchaeales archaeon]
MDYASFCGELNEDIQERKFLVLAAKCSIEYWGRSRSVIGAGDRLIIYKPDSTLLIHSPEGFKPTNWMSSPTDTIAEAGEGFFTLHSQRTKSPYEEMKIRVEHVHDYKCYCGMRDGGKLELTHTERDMQDYLAENMHLISKDFRLKAREYRTPLGFIDLYGKLNGKYCAVELKVERAGLPAALQIKRYKEWLEEHVKADAEAILVATSITPNAKKLLEKNRIHFKKFDIKTIKRPSKRLNTLDKWIDG